jgi:hypothetical protein
MVVIKGKFVPVHTMKQYGRVEHWMEVSGQLHVPTALPTEKEPPKPYQLNSRLVVCRAVLDTAGIEKYFHLYRQSNHDFSVFQPKA